MKIEKGDWWFVVAELVALMGLTYAIGMDVGGCYKERAAVKAGVAEWIADDNGKAEFKWITDVD